MLLTEFFLNGIRTKTKAPILTEEQKRRLYEFDCDAGYTGDYHAWKDSLICPPDIKARERYQQAVAAGTKLSFEEYKEKVLNEKSKTYSG